MFALNRYFRNSQPTAPATRIASWVLLALGSACLLGCGPTQPVENASAAAEAKPTAEAEATAEVKSATPVQPAAAATTSSATTELAAAVPAESESKTATQDLAWGTLQGKFVYDGPAPTPAKVTVKADAAVCGKFDLADESLLVDPNGGLANVVIYVSTKGVKTHPDFAKTAKDSIMLDNKNCTFEPHIQLLRQTQTLVLHNSDPMSHNSNLQPTLDTPINPLIPPGGHVDYQFSRIQKVPQPVGCNIHPWMKAWVLPRDNPYFAVTGPDGTFEISKLPTGEELQFQVWHEKAGYLAADDGWKKGVFTLTIPPEGHDLGTIKVKPALFTKK